MKDIFKRICYAQIASDGGKNIDILKEYAPKIWEQGYKSKDREILRAIQLIKSGKGAPVSYYVKQDYFSKKVGKYCYIVYFNWRDSSNNARQVSFHSFCEQLEEYCPINTEGLCKDCYMYYHNTNDKHPCYNIRTQHGCKLPEMVALQSHATRWKKAVSSRDTVLELLTK